MVAPSTRAASLTQGDVWGDESKSAKVPKPQSVSGMTRSEPTIPGELLDPLRVSPPETMSSPASVCQRTVSEHSSTVQVVNAAMS